MVPKLDNSTVVPGLMSVPFFGSLAFFPGLFAACAQQFALGRGQWLMFVNSNRLLSI